LKLFELGVVDFLMRPLTKRRAGLAIVSLALLNLQSPLDTSGIPTEKEKTEMMDGEKH